MHWDVKTCPPWWWSTLTCITLSHHLGVAQMLKCLVRTVHCICWWKTRYTTYPSQGLNEWWSSSNRLIYTQVSKDQFGIQLIELYLHLVNVSPHLPYLVLLKTNALLCWWLVTLFPGKCEVFPDSCVARQDGVSRRSAWHTRHTRHHGNQHQPPHHTLIAGEEAGVVQGPLQVVNQASSHVNYTEDASEH